MGELTYRVHQSRSHALLSNPPSLWADVGTVHPKSPGGHWQISASQKWISFAHMASCHWLDIGGNPHSIYPWPQHVANHLVNKKNVSLYSATNGELPLETHCKDGSLSFVVLNPWWLTWQDIQCSGNMQGSCDWKLVWDPFSPVGDNLISSSNAKQILATATTTASCNPPLLHNQSTLPPANERSASCHQRNVAHSCLPSRKVVFLL